MSYVKTTAKQRKAAQGQPAVHQMAVQTRTVQRDGKAVTVTLNARWRGKTMLDVGGVWLPNNRHTWRMIRAVYCTREQRVSTG